MKGETKLFLGIIGVTILVIVGTVFFFSNQPTTGPKVDSSILVRSDSEKIASDSAAVTLVEFADFQCPACGAYHPLLKQLLPEFAGKLNFVYRNFPLSQHQNAPLAAQVAEAAGRQGKFWPLYDALYDKQNEWSTAGNARDLFLGYAKALGLDTEKLNKDADLQDIKNLIDRDTQDGNAAGVNSTPTFFLNGEKLTNPASLADFRTLIKAAILKSPVTQKPAEAAYHTHFNLKVVLNGQAIDFTLPKYQSVEGKEPDESIHFHDGKGDLVHIHKKGVSLGELFNSLKITFGKDCFADDLGNKYCTGGVNTLKMLVNGKENTQFDAYEPQDLDRILISYGSESAEVVQEQVKSIADDACIYSEKCPERGTPPTEKCVGGLGSGCEDK